MQEERRGVLGVAFKGKIFVALREQDSKSRLKTCERYNTSQNEWQFNLNVPRARQILDGHIQRLCSETIQRSIRQT